MPTKESIADGDRDYQTLIDEFIDELDARVTALEEQQREVMELTSQVKRLTRQLAVQLLGNETH